MDDINLTGGISGSARFSAADVLTPEITSKIKTISELWSWAKITKDIAGDPIWEALNMLGCNPKPLDNLGYSFCYDGFNCLYLPLGKRRGLVRFTMPKLLNICTVSKEGLSERINMANSLVTESKFMILGDDIWLVHERHFSPYEDCLNIVKHILDNLRQGAEILRMLFCKHDN